MSLHAAIVNYDKFHKTFSPVIDRFIRPSIYQISYTSIVQSFQSINIPVTRSLFAIFFLSHKTLLTFTVRDLDQAILFYITKTLIKTTLINEIKVNGVAASAPLSPLSTGLDKSGVQFSVLQHATFPWLVNDLQSAAQEKA